MLAPIEPYAAPRWLYDAVQVLRPPEDLTVSQWAAKYRQLDTKSSAMPGRWLNDRTPYLVGIMDALNEYEVEDIVVCSGTQEGKTESLLNMMLFCIQQDPAPMMVVYPTDKLAESISENRIMPAIRACPTIAKLYDPLRSQKLEMQFQGMYLTLVGSNSPASLASRPIRYLFLDEVDKFPGASRKEADPISLAFERTKTFSNRKRVMTSTPTYSDGQIWRALQACDVEMHYFVPCPHCGEMIELKFSNLIWPDKETGMTAAERADQAVYVCQECGCAISDHHKDAMLRGGEWRPVRENSEVHKSKGFWMSTLYSPFVRFSEMALEFMRSKDDPEKLQNFTNSWLAEPWEDRVNGTDADMVLSHQTDIPEFTVPQWTRVLTAGVDVQQDCLYYTVRAWGPNLISQNVTHGRVLEWPELAAVMNRIYVREDGAQMQISRGHIDAGYRTSEVYEFCAMYADWAFPVQGSSHPMNVPFSASRIERFESRAYGMELLTINTGTFKDWIATRLHRKVGEPGTWLVFSGCDTEYAQQVTSEHKVRERTKSGRYQEVWRQKRSHADNHYLDCEVYAFAAAYKLAGFTKLLDVAEMEGEGNDAHSDGA